MLFSEMFILEMMKRHLADIGKLPSYDKAVLAQEKRRRVEARRAKLKVVEGEN